MLGTPRLLALAEAACVAAVAPDLDQGQTTVGIAVSLEHRGPSPVGTPIEVEAELTRIDGKKLCFKFIAYGPGEDDESGPARGTPQEPTRSSGPGRSSACSSTPSGSSPGSATEADRAARRRRQTPVVDRG